MARKPKFKFDLKFNRGSIGRIAASFVSRLTASAKRKIRKSIEDKLKELNVGCPSPERLAQLIKIKNNLLKTLNSLERRVRKAVKFLKTLETLLKIAKAAAVVLMAIPIPNLFTIIAITNLMSKFVDIVFTVIKYVEDDVRSIRKMVEKLLREIDKIRRQIERIDLELLRCAQNGAYTLEDIKELQNRPDLLFDISFLNDISTLIESGQDGNLQGILEQRGLRSAGDGNRIGTPGASAESDVPFTAENGKTYKLSVQRIDKGETIAPQRQAIARDELGVVVMKGPPSFSSSTKILIEEIKFRIENQLP